MFLLAKSKYLSGSQSNCVFLFNVNNFCAFKSLTFSNDQYILIDEIKYKKSTYLETPPQAVIPPILPSTGLVLGFSDEAQHHFYSWFLLVSINL